MGKGQMDGPQAVKKTLKLGVPFLYTVAKNKQFYSFS